MNKKAIIIGAGVSGLSAANILSNQGYNVQVFEANSIAGGRVSNYSFIDGSKVELGGMFIHDTSHPVAKLFSQGGTRYSRDEFPEGILDVMKKLQEFLLSKKDMVYNLSFRQLLQKIAVEADDIKEIIEFFKEESLGEILGLNADDITSAIHVLQELYIDVDKHSPIGSQYYLGEENGHYFPQEGYSKVVDYLQHQAELNLVNIQYGTAASSINQDNTVVLETGEVYHADKIIVAIAPYHYEKIDINLDANTKNMISEAVDYLAPDGRGKITILLDTPLKETIYTKGYTKNIFHTMIMSDSLVKFSSFNYIIYGNEESKAIYAFYNADEFSTEEATIGIPEIVKGLKEDQYISADTEIVDSVLSYTDGKSWYYQHVGFKPVDNSGDIKFLGALTGSDDSVHSVISATCDALTDDMDKCLGDLFADASAFNSL